MNCKETRLNGGGHGNSRVLGQSLFLDESKAQVLVLDRVQLANESPAEQLLIEILKGKASALRIDKGLPTLRETGNQGRD